MELSEEWVLLPKLRSRIDEENRGDFRKETETTLRGEQRRRCVARDEKYTLTEESGRNIRQVGGILFRTLLSTASAQLGVYASTFAWTLLRPRSEPVPTDDPWVPSWILLMFRCHCTWTMSIHTQTEGLLKWISGEPSSSPSPMKLLLRMLVFIPAICAATVLNSGIKMVWQNSVKAASLDAQESYMKCLGPIGCLPRTVSDMYIFETCGVSAGWQNRFGRSQEDVLQTDACLYQMLSMSENSELIKRASYGPHMKSISWYSALWACMCAGAVCLLLCEFIALFKTMWNEVTLLADLQNYCKTEYLRRVAAPGEAFPPVPLQFVRRPRYMLMDKFMMCVERLEISVSPRTPLWLRVVSPRNLLSRRVWTATNTATSIAKGRA